MDDSAAKQPRRISAISLPWRTRLSSELFILRHRAEESKVVQPRKEVVGPNSSTATSVSLHLAGLSSWSGSAAKRAFDLVGVVPALPLVFPVFLLIGMAVRITSSGPALFMQTQMGRHGRAFTIFKFRTMLQPRDKKVVQAITTSRDSRLTSLGRFLAPLEA